MSSKAAPGQVWGRRFFAGLLPLVLLVWWPPESLAYVQNTHEGVGIFWPTSPVILNLRLGCPPNGNLPAYGPCWDDAAQDAAERWNVAGAQFRFRIQSPSRPAEPTCNPTNVDRVNTVVWAATQCGMAFGENTLAVAQNWFRPTGEILDSDVFFNTTYSWSTYAGPHRSDVIDLHRVALHEFGHVLGLDHPDDHGQSVNAIMNSKADDTIRLQADDIAGIRAIYGTDGSGGGDPPPPPGGGDDHGETRQGATRVGLPSDTPGNLEESGDTDYFRLSVPRSGLLTVETTGSTDTLGALYTATGGILASDDDSGNGTNFQIARQVSAGTYYVEVSGFSSSITGSYTLRVRFSGGGVLENPLPNAFKSGIGVISGWVCEATRVEVEIGGSRMTAVYGTERLDTRSVCGDTDNGFAILYNWNRLGDGVHTARLLVDGTELARSSFRVTTFGQEFLRGAEKTITVRDFPRSGVTRVLEWEESSQNFVVREVR